MEIPGIEEIEWLLHRIFRELARDLMMDRGARGRHVASDRLLRVAGGQFAALAGKEWKSWFENSWRCRF